MGHTKFSRSKPAPPQPNFLSKMASSTPPLLEPHDDQNHHSTPNKAKIQGAIEFCQNMKIPFFKADVFRTFNVSHFTGYRILNGESSKQFHNQFDQMETRERKSIISLAQIREMEKILKKEGMEARRLTWKQLGYEIRLDCCGRTIKNVMGTMDYHKCIACKKGWVNASTTKRRVEWVTVMKERYFEKKDLYIVRFSDEVHFAYDLQDKIHIIRKSGQRYCQNCIQYTDEARPKDQKRVHGWAAANHDFKSDMHLYDVPGNTNEKMSQNVYLESILKPIVKSWLNRGDNFCLEKMKIPATTSTKKTSSSNEKTQINWNAISIVLPHLILIL